MEKKNSIFSILSSQIVVLGSWGFHNEREIENGIMFNVKGYLFSGIVKVISNAASDSYIIRLEDAMGTIFAERKGVRPEELVDTIDSLVEKNCAQEDYEKKVIAEYDPNVCANNCCRFAQILTK